MYTPESKSESLEIYRKLCLVRQSQNAIIEEYSKDEIKTPVHLGIGLEAISIGVTHCLPENTKSFGQLRNHGQYLGITGETDRFFGELYGKVTGTGGGKAGSMHLAAPEYGLISTSGIVGSTISLAVGAGFAAKYRQTDDLSVAMFGDGAVEEGEFWESLNFACLHRLKVMFVCEDNDLAIHTFGSDRRGFKNKSIANAVQGFDCHVIEGDGTDVLSVIGVVKSTVTNIIQTSKPAFLLFKWNRMLEHVGPNTDFHLGYRPQPSGEQLELSDPLHKYENFLISNGAAPCELGQIRDKVELQIRSSIDKAKKAPYPSDEYLHKG